MAQFSGELTGLPTDTCHKKRLTMATLVNNLLTKGISGTFGKTIVFKQWRNKTIIANYSPPSKQQSETQKANRSKFRDAANWAKATLKDPERKEYYQKKVKKLGLPNAYTAAITDYMRKPTVSEVKKQNGITSYCVDKKNFAIKTVTVQITTTHGTVTSRIVPASVNGNCQLSLTDAESREKMKWIVEDETGQRTELLC